MTPPLIVGAGGHAKVIADIFQQRGQAILGYLDDDTALRQQIILGYPVIGGTSEHIKHPDSALIVAIGTNHVRRQLAVRIEQQRESTRWISAVHPQAILAASVSIGLGTVIAAGAVVNPDVTIGDHAIINTAASVDHDCTIGSFVHIAPGAHLAGGVRVGDGAMIGLGALVVPYCTVGVGAVIGAGAVVLHDVPANTTVVGVPGRILKHHPYDWLSL